MQKPEFIQKMIDKNNERKRNKPRYKIEDLYIGLLSDLPDLKYYTRIESDPKYRYTACRPHFAIFYPDRFTKCLHINTNHPLDLEFHYCHDSQYFIYYPARRLEEVIRRYIIKNNLKSNSKLSINEIKEIEKEIYEQLYISGDTSLFKPIEITC